MIGRGSEHVKVNREKEGVRRGVKGDVGTER